VHIYFWFTLRNNRGHYLERLKFVFFVTICQIIWPRARDLVAFSFFCRGPISEKWRDFFFIVAMRLRFVGHTKRVKVDINNQGRAHVARGDFHECLDIRADERSWKSVVTSGIEGATMRCTPQNSRWIEGRAARPNASKLNEQTELR